MAQTLNTNGITHILRALRYRNYRLFFLGQIISLTGTWMQSLAMGWLVYRLTHSPFALGVIGFSSQIAMLFVSPFAGVWADRWHRHRVIIITQTLAMVQAFILALLVLSGRVEVWHVIVLSIFLGLVTSFDMPVRQAFTVEMIERKEDLGNAIALNSLMFNSARFIGPMVAGFLVARFNEGVCFLANAISYIAVIIALLFMKIPVRKQTVKYNHVLESMKEGFRYTFGFAPMRSILLLMALVSLVVMPYAILLPAFAKDVLHGDALTLGYLMGAAGIGALTGAIFLAAKKGVRGMGRTIAIATLIFGIGLLILSFSHTLWSSLALMFVIGFGLMVQMAGSNTVLQTLVDDDKRGRVMSFYGMAFIGLTPFGSLLAGGLASHIGTPKTIFCAGIFCIIGVLIFSAQMRSSNEIIDSAHKQGI